MENYSYIIPFTSSYLAFWTANGHNSIFIVCRKFKFSVFMAPLRCMGTLNVLRPYLQREATVVTS